MANTIKIHSGLSSIKMLDIIFHWDKQKISARRRFQGEHGFAALEACAQLSALHVRKLLNFKCHAFLLSIGAVTPLPPDRLKGPGHLEASLTETSRQAFAYKLKLYLKTYPTLDIKLIIGTTEYGEKFKAAELRRHYSQLFESLCPTVISGSSDDN